MAEMTVKFLLEKLGKYIEKEAKLLGGIGKHIKEIQDELESMQAFLKDTDGMKHPREVFKTWVAQVRRVAYDVEDAIYEFELRFGKKNEGGGIMNSLNTLSSAMKRPFPTHDFAIRLKEIKRSIATVRERKDRYATQQMKDEDQSPDTCDRQSQGCKEANFLEQAEVVGIEKNIEGLIEQVVAVTGNGRKTFISVYGMPGVGKSTLVRKAYQDPKLTEHFNCFAWLYVSQSFKFKDLLKFMLIEFGDTRERNSSQEARENTLPSQKVREKMSEVELRKEVQKYLQGKRFILVLDDVWDKKVCVDMNLALPEKYNGSKIIITTRIQSLASELEGENINSVPHELKSLSEGAARELLQRKAFRGRAITPELEDVFESMVQKCAGLPLAIVALGGILRKKTSQQEWQKVNNSLSEQVANYDSTSKGTSIRSILKLSYDELPFHLKPCFLYCALFPEDHLIKRNKLIRLWVAEGFIEEGSDGTMEEVGEDYLRQLIGRIMLQIELTNIDGSRVRSCRVHDLMRRLAISISREEEFFFKLEKQGGSENATKPRRMSVIGDSEGDGISSATGIQPLRTLLFFNVPKGRTPDLILYSKFKLLRVLDLEHVGIKELPVQIAQLLHLKYLSLNRNYQLKHLPSSIGSLGKLETLDIRRTEIDKLPEGIARLKKLRHLCMRIGTQVPKGISNLRCLQTLIGVRCSEKGIGEEIGKLEKLRRLTISGVKEEDAKELDTAISGMAHLCSLRIDPANDTLLFSKRLLLKRPPPNLRILSMSGLSELPLTLGSINNLIRLTLGSASLREDPFPSLSSLPSLLHLDLRGLDNVEGLQCGPQGFPKLQKLELYGMRRLKTVAFERGSTLSLKQLVISCCPKLQMVPQGIQCLNLQELELKDMPEGFVKRLKEGGEDCSKVQGIPLIRVIVSTNSTKLQELELYDMPEG